MRRTTIFAIAVLLLAATAMSAHATTITVTNTNDSGPGSLRQALAVAHDGDHITFAVSGTITLTSGGLGIHQERHDFRPWLQTNSGVNGNHRGRYCVCFRSLLPEELSVSLACASGTAQVGVYNNQGTVSVSNCVLTGNSSAGLYNHTGASMTWSPQQQQSATDSGTGADNTTRHR